MSEPMTKQRPTIDLDDFERRLRQSQPPASRDEDPLAELARLVGEQHDPYGDVFAREAAPAVREAGRQEPGFGDGDLGARSAQPSMSPRLFGDFAAIEAGLRGSLPPHAEPYASQHGQEPSFAQGHAEPSYDAGHAYPEPTAYDENWQEPARQLQGSRSRRPMALVAATIAVGVIGIGTAFALKGHIATSPREVKTILADSSPTKVQPPADAAADTQASQDAAVLGKSQPTPTRLVNREEQPVDVAQAVQDNAARAAQSRGGIDASSVPVPPSPGQVQTASVDPSAMPGQSFPLSDMPAPKRVRVVSVKPDGTILPDDRPPAAAIPAPRQSAGKTSDRAGPVAKASTPKTAAPKSTSRVTTPKSIDQLAAGDVAAPAVPPAAKAPKKAKPQRVASADTGTQEATDAVTPEPSAAASGGFAVQLAAPGSESDAKATSSRLAKKFAGSLGGRHLAFHKAESNGKSVFRVRVSSLSKADAVSLCEKLKADGGSCFVAKN